MRSRRRASAKELQDQKSSSMRSQSPLGVVTTALLKKRVVDYPMPLNSRKQASKWSRTLGYLFCRVRTTLRLARRTEVRRMMRMDNKKRMDSRRKRVRSFKSQDGRDETRRMERTAGPISDQQDMSPSTTLGASTKAKIDGESTSSTLFLSLKARGKK